MHAPVRELAFERVGLDRPLRPGLLALLLILNLDEAPLPDPLGERGDEVGLGLARAGLWCLAELELPERLLELVAHAVERTVRVRRDHRTDEFKREPDRACLQRCQAWGVSESVTVEFLVDMYAVTVECGVDRVT